MVNIHGVHILVHTYEDVHQDTSITYFIGTITFSWTLHLYMFSQQMTSVLHFSYVRGNKQLQITNYYFRY